MQSKNVSFLPKILIHVLAISLVMIGLMLLHVVYNSTSIVSVIVLFGNEIERSVVFDIGLICVTMGFFIEFLFTFKPIHVIHNKREK